jgi:hypothetical protein
MWAVKVESLCTVTDSIDSAIDGVPALHTQ